MAMTTNKRDINSQDVLRRIVSWFATGDSGISSHTIVSAIYDEDLSGDRLHSCGIPMDVSDFARCHRLIQAAPELMDHFDKLTTKFPEWKPFVDQWDSLARICARDLSSRGPSGTSAELMRKIYKCTYPHKSRPNSSRIERYVFNEKSGPDAIQPMGHLMRSKLLMTVHKAEIYFEAAMLLGPSTDYAIIAIPDSVLAPSPLSGESINPQYLKYPEKLNINGEKFSLISGPYPLSIPIGSITIQIDGPYEASLIASVVPPQIEDSRDSATEPLNIYRSSTLKIS